MVVVALSVVVPLRTAAAPVSFDLKVAAIPYDLTSIAETVALEHGLFAKYGLRVTMQDVIGGQRGTQAVISGNAHITNSSPAPAFAAIVQGADLVTFATSFPASPYYFLSRVPIGELRQIGVSGPGLSADRTAAILVLRRLGGDPNRMTYVPVGATTARMAALEQGTIQAAMVPLYVAVNYDKQQLRLLADTPALGIPFVVDDWITTRQFYGESIRVIEAFSRAIIEANAFILNPRNRDAVLKLLTDSRGSGFNAAQAQAAYTFAVKYMIKKYPSVNREGLRTLLEVLGTLEPTMSRVALDKYIMDEPLRSLERTGFADQFYGR